MHNSIPPLSVQGGLFTFKREGGKPSSLQDVKRGRIRDDFSPGSRMRLMRFFSVLDFDAYASTETPFLFLTLTTPPSYWGRLRDVYSALRRFHDWLCKTGFEAAIVKREYGKRGMLHYHLVIIGLPYLSATSIRTAWTRALRAHAPVRVGVERVEDPSRIARYLSKYVSKVGYGGSAAGFESSRDSGEAEMPAALDPVTLSIAHNVDSLPASVGDSSPSSSQGSSPGSPGASSLGAGGDVADVGQSSLLGQSGAESGHYSGGRWWYTWGDFRKSEIQTLDVENTEHFAKQVRRVFRRWRMARARSAVAASGIPPARRAHKFLSRNSGFSVMASPDVLWNGIYAALLITGQSVAWPNFAEVSSAWSV